MAMELEVSVRLSDGGAYPNEQVVTRRFEIQLPWAPGNHEAEIALVEATESLIKFGEIIGELHEELTHKYEDKLAAAEFKASKGRPEPPPPTGDPVGPAEPELTDPLAGLTLVQDGE